MLGLQGFALIVASGLGAALLTGLAITGCRRLGILADRPNGIQNVHRHWAPRMGGLPLFLTLLIGTLVWQEMPERNTALLLLACALPALVAGLIEDLGGGVGPMKRLLATFICAGLAWVLIDGQLRGVDVPFLDYVLENFGLASFLFTAFAVGGVAHSINIIDGFNGLSTFFCVICFAALFIVATVVGDPLIQGLSLLFAGSLLGFLAWNFPFGRVFLGDAGAYFLGFSLGEICVLLVARNPEVSPWFCFLLMAYPIWDTLFSSYRREFKRRTRWSDADALHLHHLIYRRLVRPFSMDGDTDLVVPNSLTSVYVWVLALMCAVPAVLFWDSTALCVGFVALFGASYGLFYRRLAKFRAPRMLTLPLRRTVRIAEVPVPAPRNRLRSK